MKLPPGHVAGQVVAKPKCTGGFGERMLRTMGWQNGKGLGKDGTGIKEAIQVKKKEDTVGVGGNSSYAWGDKWWEKAFDSALQTVGDSDSSDSSDSDSDDEHITAIAVAVNRDGTRTSASADELRLLASLSKGGRVAAGRFGGHDAKMARIRQQEAAMAGEAAAKLGLPSAATTSAGHDTAATTTGADPVAAAAVNGTARGGSERSDTTSEVKLSGGSSKKRKAAAAAVTAGCTGEPSAADSQAARSGSKAGKEEGKKVAAAPGGEAPAAAETAQQGMQQPPKKQQIVIEPAVAAVRPAGAFVRTPATGWWGAKCFASAGCLEGLEQSTAEAQRRRMTFDEDDQARIFTAAHAKKTQGKVGLGQGTGTINVGGVKWEGKRVSFEEPEGSAAEAEGPAAGNDARLTAIGSCTHLDTLAAGGSGSGKRQRKAEAAAQQRQPAVDWHVAVKWRKIICQQLQAAEQQQLKVKELQRLVVAAVLAKHSSIVSSRAAVKAAFASRLEGSRKWVVEGTLVRLSS